MGEGAHVVRPRLRRRKTESLLRRYRGFAPAIRFSRSLRPQPQRHRRNVPIGLSPLQTRTLNRYRSNLCARPRPRQSVFRLEIPESRFSGPGGALRLLQHDTTRRHTRTSCRSSSVKGSRGSFTSLKRGAPPGLPRRIAPTSHAIPSWRLSPPQPLSRRRSVARAESNRAKDSHEASSPPRCVSRAPGSPSRCVGEDGSSPLQRLDRRPSFAAAPRRASVSEKPRCFPPFWNSVG
jgi:hypothetical protein